MISNFLLYPAVGIASFIAIQWLKIDIILVVTGAAGGGLLYNFL